MKKLFSVALVAIISISLTFGASPALAQTEENNKAEVAVSGEEASDNQTVTKEEVSENRTTTGKEVAVSGEEGSDNQTVTKEETSETQTTTRVVTVNTGLMEEYHRLVKMLGEAESKGDKELTKTLLEKIRVIKERIEKATEESSEPQLVAEKPTRVVPREVTAVSSPTRLDKCAELKAWERKKQHYGVLYALSDAELKDKGYSEGHEEVSRIIRRLEEGIKRLRIECEANETGGVAGGAPVLTSEQRVVAVTLRPIAVESGVEITDYYQRRIAEIAAREVGIETQIAILKELRNEIDRLIEELIKSKDKITIKEFSGLVTRIAVRPGELKMDNVIVKTVAKSVLTRVNNRDLEIKPTRTGVILQDGTIQVKAAELSIETEILRVGNSEVKLMPSVVIEKFKIEPKEMELKEENAKAVYKIKTAESRKLFGFIPVKVEKTSTVDAANTVVKIIKEESPWWAFLTTK